RPKSNRRSALWIVLAALQHHPAALHPDAPGQALSEDLFDRGFADLDGDFVATLDQHRVQSREPARAGDRIELEQEDGGDHVPRCEDPPPLSHQNSAAGARENADGGRELFSGIPEKTSMRALPRQFAFVPPAVLTLASALVMSAAVVPPRLLRAQASATPVAEYFAKQVEREDMVR